MRKRRAYCFQTKKESKVNKNKLPGDIVLLFGGLTDPIYCFVCLVAVVLSICVLMSVKLIAAEYTGILLILVGLSGMFHVFENAVAAFYRVFGKPRPRWFSKTNEESKEEWDSMNSVFFGLSLLVAFVGIMFVVLSGT